MKDSVIRLIQDTFNTSIENVPAPINLMKIAKYMDIKVAAGEISSVVTVGKLRNGDRKIAVNASLSVNDKRYAVALGLGHFFLDHLTGTITAIANKDVKSNAAETVACRRFALHLLAPKPILDRMMFEQRIVELTNMAKILLVNENLIRQQLTYGD